jgi:pyruvate ferredoxin oxidoreductase gamma subunit
MMAGFVGGNEQMKEIRIHGRGGQGSLVLAQFMAIAALEDDKYGQAFPFLGGGGERRGKPIMAYCRMSDQPIRLRCRVTEPDYVIVQDATIMDELDVTEGLSPDGLMLVNTESDLSRWGMNESPYRVMTFSGDALARKILGRPIINTALLGAFAAVTNELSFNAVISAVKSKFPGELGEKNARVVEESYKQMKERAQ